MKTKRRLRDGGFASRMPTGVAPRLAISCCIVATVAFLATGPAAADGFCVALKQVIASANAHSHFAEVRGPATGADSHGAPVYHSPSVVLPGAAPVDKLPACTVETSSGGWVEYSCRFVMPDSRAAAARAIAGQVAACLGVPVGDPMDDGFYGYNYSQILVGSDFAEDLNETVVKIDIAEF